MIHLDTESKKGIKKDKFLTLKRIIYLAVIFIFAVVLILIYFYFNTFNKKVSIKEDAYIFWEDTTIDPTLCEFKFEGRFERYLFSNQKNTLVGKIYINDALVINGAWTFSKKGYALLIILEDESASVNEEYDGFILNVNLNSTDNIMQKQNEKNKCLIITPANNIEDTLLEWQRYDYNPEYGNLKQWQLDILNNPNKTLNRLKGELE